MSKADELGASSAFSRARGSRRRATEEAIGSSSASTAGITELPPDSISFNPDNPRDHLRDLDDTVASVREVGIVLPIIVATTEAYLKERPDRAGDLEPDTQYLVVDGHRRLEAARRAGLTMIDVRVDNDRVSTDEKLLETAFVANYHRDDMTELEEATALKALVEHYGSQTKAAQRLGIPQGTISSKLSLLKLSPDLQADLQNGERTYEQVRNLGKLTAEEQRAKADERAEAARLKAKKEREEAERLASEQAEAEAAAQEESAAGEAGYPAGINGAPDTSPAGETGETAADTGEKAVPEPRVEREQPDPPRRPSAASPPPPLPYDDGNFVGMHLARKMDDAPFALAARVVVSQAWDKLPLEDNVALLRRMLDLCQQQSPDDLAAIVRQLVADDEALKKLLQSEMA